MLIIFGLACGLNYCIFCHCRFFDTLEYIGRLLDNWGRIPAMERPFGGLQLICCGDFYQVGDLMSRFYAFETESEMKCQHKY